MSVIPRLTRLLADSLYAPIATTPRNYSGIVDPTVTDDLDLGYKIGDVWLNTATTNVFDAISVADGAAIWRHRPRLLAMSGTPVTHTGNTTQTALVTVTVPANAIGPNGTLRIRYIASMTNNANNKIFRVVYSTIGGTVFDSIALASVNGAMRELTISNRNAPNSQVGRYLGTGTGGWTSFSTIATTASVDTTASTTLIISIELANGADTGGLDWYSVELLRS